MHQALYRKYRPQVFEDVCGQRHITDVLRYQAERDRVSHAYLFCGSRGTGKTTCAKILAKAVNCSAPVGGSPCCKCQSCLDIDSGAATDVIEMDAASNNGVDDIRRICEEVVYTPSMLRKKVYIIDEVHMLSQGAFNALLKTIEEPPSHVVFILATTELHKIPATIVSRCQRFDFRRIDMNVIADRLLYIAEREGALLERGAAQMLARQAQGGMRDAIGLFELCGAGGSDVTEERVKSVLGLSGYESVAQTVCCVKENKMGELFAIVDGVVSSSKDLTVFWQELIGFVRDMLVCKYSDDAAEYLDLTAAEAQLLGEASAKFTLSELVYYCKILDEGSASMARTPQNKRITAEMCLMRMCRPELDNSAEALSARIAKLEDKLALFEMGGAPIPPSAPRPEPSAVPMEAEKEPAAEKGDAGEEADALVSDISEAVSRIGAMDPALPEFLRLSEVRLSADGKRLTICSDGFGHIMLSTSEAIKNITEAFALARITNGRAEVSIVKKAIVKKSASPADELGGLL